MQVPAYPVPANMIYGLQPRMKWGMDWAWRIHQASIVPAALMMPQCVRECLRVHTTCDRSQEMIETA